MGVVSGDFRVALRTWKPLATALKFDRDNIDVRVIVSAAGLQIYVNPIYFFTVDEESHFF